MVDLQSGKPTLLSDGKRMRSIWRPSDGNGEPSRHLVERSITTLKGHPTWKLFIDDIELPILRGSANEPPHYVYLGDKACYTVWCTALYTKDELREFWPFDFDNLGNVKTGRKNRGGPAYSDEDETIFAKTPLRGKKKWYEFLGAPEEVTDYAPIRPKKKTRAEIEVEKEYAERDRIERDDSEDVPQSELLRSPQPALTIDGTPVRDTDDIDPSRPLPFPSPHIPYQSSERLLPENSLSLGLKPLPLSSRTVVNPVGTQQTPRKRKLIQPFDVSSSESSPVMSSPKRTSLGSDPMQTPLRVVPTSFSMDGASDYDGSYNVGMDGANDCDSEYYDTLAERCTRAQITRPESGLQSGLQYVRGNVAQLKEEIETLTAQNEFLSKENQHLRAVLVQLLAANAGYQANLSSRVVALQRASNSYHMLGNEVQRIAAVAAAEVAPTKLLSDDIGTVLDGPGKYMYDNGLDEEWRVLQLEADKLNRRKDNTPPSSQQKLWNFS